MLRSKDFPTAACDLTITTALGKNVEVEESMNKIKDDHFRVKRRGS